MHAHEQQGSLGRLAGDLMLSGGCEKDGAGWAGHMGAAATRRVYARLSLGAPASNVEHLLKESSTDICLGATVSATLLSSHDLQAAWRKTAVFAPTMHGIRL